jgi:restriction endonuclease S subunit
MSEQYVINSLLIDLFSGFSFRTKVENEIGGDLSVIQMKDLYNNYSSIRLELTKISSDKISPKFFLQKGDVLFIAKGSNNFAIEYNLDLPKVIAASAFFVLRPNMDRVIPGYLAWFINQTPVQQYLKENMAGSYIPNINKSTIEGIMVSLPTMDVQEKIALIDELRKRENVLMTQIMEKREAAVRTLLLNTVNN